MRWRPVVALLLGACIVSAGVVAPAGAQETTPPVSVVSDSQIHLQIGGNQSAKMSVWIHYGLFTHLFQSGGFGTRIVGGFDGERVIAVQVDVVNTRSDGFRVVSYIDMDLPMVGVSHVSEPDRTNRLSVPAST